MRVALAIASPAPGVPTTSQNLQIQARARRQGVDHDVLVADLNTSDRRWIPGGVAEGRRRDVFLS